MKPNVLMFASAITGLSLLAVPALSQQDRPTQPAQPGQRPTTPPGQMGNMEGNQQFRNAVKMLEGTWSVSVRAGGQTGGAQPGAAGSQQGGQTYQATSTRNWILNDMIMEENVRASQVPSLGRANNADNALTNQVNPDRPGQTPGQGNQPRGNQSMDQFEGHGMFGFDSRTNQFQHTWVDSEDSKITFSTGRYDERTRTFTFTATPATGARTAPEVTPQQPRTTPTPNTPGTSPTTPPGTRDNNDDLRNQVSTQPVRPGTGASQPANMQGRNINRIVIRILDENRHTVEYFAEGSGDQNRLLELTYTRSR